MRITNDDAAQLKLILNAKADHINSEIFALMFYLDGNYIPAMYWNFTALEMQDKWIELTKNRSEGASVLWDKLDGLERF